MICSMRRPLGDSGFTATTIVGSVLLLASLSWVTDVRAQNPSADQIQFFESKIRPILVDHCYECHSTNAEEVEAGLVLDSRWGWEKGGDSGAAIVPGDPDKSNLIDAVRYTENIVSGMPPRSKLPEEQIKLLERWVEMGAPDPREKVKSEGQPIEAFDLDKRFHQHWSWRPVARPSVPTVKDTAWPKDDLDRFVLRDLESKSIVPAEPAKKEIWLRRVYFDVVGLPPTPAQIDAYLSDESEDAEEKVVDSLLASEQYGAKWARHWMDLVRYAETYGHEFDYPLPHATEYRDYLIRAFNQDIAYDKFVIEHIAGDMVGTPRRHPTEHFNESVIGTGFWYLHEATHAPTDVLTNEADIIDNQLDVFGKSFLGLTVACARCHDHKFDAISTADYYALSAFLQSSCRQLYPLDPGRKAEKAIGSIVELSSRASQLVGHGLQRNVVVDAIKPYLTALEAVAKQNPGLEISADEIQRIAQESKLDLEVLNRWIEQLKSAGLDGEITPMTVMRAQVTGHEAQESIDQRIEAAEKRYGDAVANAVNIANFSDVDLPEGWNATGFGFEIANRRPMLGVTTLRPKKNTVDSGLYGAGATGILRSPTFTLEKPQIHLLVRAGAGIKINAIIDNYQMAPYNALLFRGTFINGGGSDTKGKWQWKTLGGDLRKYVGHNVYLEIADEGGSEIAIDQIWMSDGGAPPVPVDSLAGDMAAAEDLSSVYGIDDWLLREQLVPKDSLPDELSRLIEKTKSVSSSIPGARYVLAMAEGTRENASIYIRGSSGNLGDPVPPRNLQALGGKAVNRLELARQIASSDNPLVSRVFVNRVWHYLTGRGIVASVDDFGPQGFQPTHPELLDYLSAEFMDDGWSIKSLIKRVVLSQTYRQSSVANPANPQQRLAEQDPTNALLHRMRVRRLPGESIRDAILVCSGRLNDQPMRGSVATHRTPFMTGRGARGSGPLDGDGRRSVYLSVYRNFLNPFMLAFDMPNPFGPKGRRSDSNVPAQALTLMNDPLVIQQAKVWAQRVVKSEVDDTIKLTEMVRLAHGVAPNAAQLRRFGLFLEAQKKEYGNNETQAWADVAHALFNMKSFYFLK